MTRVRFWNFGKFGPKVFLVSGLLEYCTSLMKVLNCILVMEELTSGLSIEFFVATSSDVQKLTWRTNGPQNLFIQVSLVLLAFLLFIIG